MADGLLNKASIILTPTGYKAGTLYNVAPVVEPYEDFDFARASVASRVNSSGLVEMVGRTLGSELVTNGDFATDSDWTLGTGWSIGDGKASYDNSGTASLTQSFTWENGKTYEIQFEVLDFTSNYRFDLYTGSSFIQSAIVTDKTTWKIYFVGDGGTIMRFRALTTGAFSLDNVSVKEVIDTNNIPRISYDSNGDNGHILLEPTSTNLVGLSEFINPSQAGWAEVATNTYTNNYSTAPDGNQTSTRVQFVNPNSSSQLFYLFNSTSGEYSASIYAKGSGTLKFGFYDNASVLTDTITLTSEWQRFEVTKTLQTTSNARFWIYPEGVSAATDIEIWGAQAEALSYPTSYIPTLTGSTEIRATETATGAGSADLINSTEGVLYAEIAALADDISGFRVLGISDGGSTNRIFIGYTSNNIYANVGAGTTIGSPYTPTNASNFHKVALKYENNNCKFFVDGSQIGSTTTSITIPSGMNSLQFDSGAGGSDFYGKCKALAVFNEALSDSELTQLTT